MRTVQTILFVVLLFVCAAKADYVITWTLDTLNESQNESRTITNKIKGVQSRYDIADLSLLFDSTSDEITVLNHPKQTYSKLTGESVKRKVDGITSVSPDKQSVQGTTDLKPTGRTETINGYKTEEFIGSSGGLGLRIFVDKDFPIDKYDANFRRALSSPVFDPFAKLGSLADKCPGMPIRIVYELGNFNFTMTLQAIRETSLEDGDFKIPTDYDEETATPPIDE